MAAVRYTIGRILSERGKGLNTDELENAPAETSERPQTVHVHFLV